MSPRVATTGIFAINGAAIGSWVAQIPFVQQRFDLSNTALGFLLLSISLGVIVATPIMGQVIARRGSLFATRAGAAACCALLPVWLLAPHPGLAALGLLGYGAANGALDVSMNAHGVVVESRMGRPIMSSLHAGWSLGGLLGAGCVALSTAAGIDPRLQLFVIAVILALAAAACARRLGPGSAAGGTTAAAFRRPTRGVLVIALTCLLVMVTEGAMGDWSGVYLANDMGAGAGVAAAGFAALSLGMTVGRLGGDAVNSRIGPVRVLRGGATLAAAGLALALISSSAGVALLGFALAGLGLANGVPLMFSAAGRAPEMAAGPAIAAVSSMGSIGFLAGPPLIGAAADLVGLAAALAGLCVALGAVAVLARVAATDVVLVTAHCAGRANAR